MKNPIQKIIDQQGFVVLDGALATQLEAKGADLNNSLWSAKILIENPQLIKEVHTDYLEAGADLICTSTYQATLEGFLKRGLNEKQAKALFLKSVELATEARDQFWKDKSNRKGRLKPLVAASIGPYGAFLADGSEYSGQYALTKPELKDFHYSRIEILVKSDADLLLFETIPSFEEAIALIEVMESFPTFPYLLSFSCKGGLHISDGTRFSRAVNLADQSPQALGVGINCTPPNYIEGLLKSVQGINQVPLMVYPNSGEIWDAQHNCWLENRKSETWLEKIELWRRLGVKIFGGCCRTTPKDISLLRMQLENKL